MAKNNDGKTERKTEGKKIPKKKERKIIEDSGRSSNKGSNGEHFERNSDD